MLTETFTDGEQRFADISEDGIYRRVLGRIWDPQRPLVLFCGLNPSTADGKDDDHTIRKERGFTKLWYPSYPFGGFLKVNMFDYRATKPRDLIRTCRELGAYVSSVANDETIRVAAADPRVALIVVAWGGLNPTLRWRKPVVASLLKQSGKPVQCLGLTNTNEPKHTLYIPYATSLIPWENSHA